MGTIIIPQRFSQRYDTVANWTAKNPVLWAGEIAYGTVAGKVTSARVGNGTSTWSALPEAGGGSLTDVMAGANVSIDKTDPAKPVVSSTLGAIDLKGRKLTYAALPSSGNASGDAWLVDADNLVYIWNGSAWPANGAGLAVASTGDPYWPSVVSLLDMAGVDGGTTFTDKVPGRTWTATGVTTTTSTKMFGTSSAYFNGSGYLRSDTSSDFGFGTGDYTIEAILRFGSPGDNCLVDTRGASAQGIGLYPTTSFGAVYTVANNSANILTGKAVGAGVFFQHLALVRMNGTLGLFQDGILTGQVLDARTLASSSALTVGASFLSTQKLTGYVDSLRVTKGVARYRGTFAPPLQAFPTHA